MSAIGCDPDEDVNGGLICLAYVGEGDIAFQGYGISIKGPVEDGGDDSDDVYSVYDIVLCHSEADPWMEVLGRSCASCAFEWCDGTDGLHDGMGLSRGMVETHCNVL